MTTQLNYDWKKKNFFELTQTTWQNIVQTGNYAALQSIGAIIKSVTDLKFLTSPTNAEEKKKSTRLISLG